MAKKKEQCTEQQMTKQGQIGPRVVVLVLVLVKGKFIYSKCLVLVGFGFG